MTDRREFLAAAGLAAGATLLAGCPATRSGSSAGMGAASSRTAVAREWFRISLAQWSLNRALFGGKLDNLDFPVVARRDFGIDTVEYVNQFFMDKATDRAYLVQLKQRCDDNGVTSGLIMCDREGALGDADAAARTRAVENHYKWVEAAKFLGCHSIRVNAQSSGTMGAQLDHAVDGLRRLAQFGAQHGINVIVENHGGYSSHGKWLSAVIEQVALPNCGTLPDFGNFTLSQGQVYDRYLGVTELMPFAKGVSAKSYAFDGAGNETTIDFRRMLSIVRDAGFRGHIGVEFEGRNMDEADGIRSTKVLLERLRAELAPTA
ncbi:MAG TPA: TIM barrel protein [Steroidobacteraceae bacterium]|nr:TIM barrel protein [Steroidobacteraceae bacterium]